MLDAMLPRKKTTRALARGKRVFVRRPSVRDEQEYLSMVEKSRRLHTPWIYIPRDPNHFRDYLHRCRENNFEGLFVCRLQDGDLVGVFNLSQIFMSNFKSAYLGFYVSADHQGQGYMSEGLALVLRHAFRTLKLHRIEANIQPGNRTSLALVERRGFREEGFSPRYLKVGGRWRDHERWAITLEDWQLSAKR